MIHLHHRWGLVQRLVWKLTALCYLQAPALSPQSDKAHAEVRWLYPSVYQPLRFACRHLVVNTTPRYLNVSTCYSVYVLPLTCRVNFLGFLERHKISSVLLVLILFPASSHGTENRSSARGWRPISEGASSLHSSAKSIRLIRQLPTTTPLLMRLWLSVQFI